MSMLLANPAADSRVSFIVKHTFIEVQGEEAAEELSPRKASRRHTDQGPLRVAHGFESIPGDDTPSTCDGDECEEQDMHYSVARRVSFSSVDSDVIIGARSLSILGEWSATHMVDVASTGNFADTKTEIPWKPCLSLNSTLSSGDDTPSKFDGDESKEQDMHHSVARRVSFSSVASDDIIGTRSLSMSCEWSATQMVDAASTGNFADTKTEIPWAPCSSLNSLSTFDGDESEEQDHSVARRVSFSSVDSDDIIGARSLSMSGEWSAARMLDSTSIGNSTDMKTETPWAPCLSLNSTISSDSQTPWAPRSSTDSSYSLGSFGLCPTYTSNDREHGLQAHGTERILHQRQNMYSSEEALVLPHDATQDENRTTVMVRNIPSHLSQAAFVTELIARGYRGLFDFVYMPMSLRSNEYGCFGYAFVNFTSASLALQLKRQLQLLEADDKEWRVVWSSCQGLAANVERYRNSPLMHDSVPADCKPALYDEHGDQVKFPAPTKNIQKPRIHHRMNSEKQNESGDVGAKTAAGTCGSQCDIKAQHYSRRGKMYARVGQQCQT